MSWITERRKTWWYIMVVIWTLQNKLRTENVYNHNVMYLLVRALLCSLRRRRGRLYYAIWGDERGRCRVQQLLLQWWPAQWLRRLLQSSLYLMWHQLLPLTIDNSWREGRAVMGAPSYWCLWMFKNDAVKRLWDAKEFTGFFSRSWRERRCDYNII